ncbi:aminotransferase class IV [Kutzneria kofuensis]|uniref:Branched-chain amino acid aminotransferase n=1 Tax=Kutzneria kofuensis TaxID=103725 RepID=A0A7W9KPI5_9PSEU|nr:aminotransferase class IV [Kutzneria kofuensis]MBB5896355.1 branched-chain amino acid aminotransferase [Kutzneria kofuensis]
MTHAPGGDHLWRSGRIVPSAEATVHVRSVGHASVSAVFEGVNAYRDDSGGLNVFRLEEHLTRLADSVRLSHLTMSYTVDELCAATVELLRRNEVRDDVHIRPWAFVEGNPIEQMVPAGAGCEVVIDCWPFRSRLAEPVSRIAAVTSWRRVASESMPPRIKAFANYHNGRLGNIDAQSRGADWPIFLDDRGRVTESSGATIGLVRDGVFHTPGLDCGILEGVTRDTVLRLLRDELDVPVREHDLTRADLHLADEVMFIGTSAEVLPITVLDGTRAADGVIGPVTTALREEYAAVLRGRRPRYKHWLTPVWVAEPAGR